MAILEIKMPNSLKDGHTHACPHRERNTGAKTSVKALDYGQTCRTCGYANPPVLDANGKSEGDTGFDASTAKNWHSVQVTSEQLKALWAAYPYADFEVITDPLPPRPPRPVRTDSAAAAIQAQVDAAVAKALKAAGVAQAKSG